MNLEGETEVPVETRGSHERGYRTESEKELMVCQTNHRIKVIS